MKNKTITNLQPALDYFKTGKAIAELLNLNPMAVTRWKSHGIPVSRAIELSQLSNGAFRAYDILKHPMLENIR